MGAGAGIGVPAVGRAWMQASIPQQGRARGQLIPQCRCHPGAYGNRRFHAGGCCPAPRRVSPPRRRFGAGPKGCSALPSPRRGWTSLGSVRLRCQPSSRCRSSSSPAGAPPPGSGGAGCRAGGAALSASPGVMPGCGRGAAPAAARPPLRGVRQEQGAVIPQHPRPREGERGGGGGGR